MLNLTVVVDNDEAIRRFRELQKVAKTTTSNIVTDSDRMDMAMRRIATSLGSLGVGLSLTEFARKVSMVRGEFQQLEVAFTTMLGSKAEADKLMSETVEFAAKTPFDLQGVAAGSKQLLAYGSSASEVTGELRMLGDIAAGLSIPLGDLVYLYGTTRTQGRMFTMDLRQFMGRGIPLAEELAKQFGVTKDQVSKLVTEGKVGFNDMKQALVSMTSEGGKFYNLMEEQSKTITGKMSNLGDAVDQMFNNIGKQSEGIISGAIDSAAYLVENYEKIGKVLMDIIVAYGSYKAAVMTVNVLNKAQASGLFALTVAEQAHYAVLVVKDKLMKAMAVTKYLTNPYVLAGAAVAALVFGTYKLITAKSLEEKAQEKVNKQMEEYNQKAEEERQKASESISAMKDANKSTYERTKAYKALVDTYPELLEKYDKEKIKLMEIAELEKEIAGITQQRALKEANDKIAEYDKKIAGGAVVYGMSGQISTDTNQINKWKAERAEWEKKRNKILVDQAEAEFDALPKQEKVQKLTKDIEALNTQVAEYNKKIDDAPEWGKTSLTMARDGVKAQIAELEKEKSTLEDAIEKEKAESTGEEEKKKQKAIAKAREDAIKEANKAEQDAIREGITDKIKLLEFEKEAELAEIQSRIDATTDSETKAALQRKYNAVEMRYDTRIGAEQTQRDKDAEEAQKQHLNSLLEQYATYEMKRKALIEKAEQDIIDLQSVNINGENDAVIENVKAQLNEDIKQLNEQTFVDTDDFQSFVDSLVGKAVNELETIKNGLKEILANTTDPKQRGLLETQINAIDKLSKERKTEPPTKKEKWTTMLSAINDVGSSARDALDNIEGMDEGLKDMLSTSLELANGVGNLVFAIIGVGEAAKGIEKASVILAAISAAIQVASMLFKVFTGESSENKTLKAFKELNTEIRRLKDESKLENWEDTIFGSDGFGKATYAMSLFREKLNELKGALDVSNLFGMSPKDYTKELATALRAMSVQTRHSTMFRSAKYDSLANQLPELFNEDGSTNMDALKEFVDSDLFNKLSKENQNLIKELVHDWELYEEALDGVKDYLSGIFGDLSNNLMDAMTNAFVSGTDAAEEFGDALSGVLEQFAQDMIYNLLFADMFKKAQDDMLAVMGDESLSSQDKFSNISDLFGGLLNDVEAQSNNAMDLYKELQRRAEEEGIDLFGKDTESQQDATSKGFQAMSQDTGDELNGRFTDIQGKVTEIRDYILRMMASGQMRLGEMINIRDIAIQLNGNVEQIKTYSMVLPEMNDTLASMNKKLDNL